MEDVAWSAYINEKKTALTQKASPQFADPDDDLSVHWKRTRDKLIAAEARQKDSATHSRILLICGADRNDGTCAGEMSKGLRLMQIAEQVLEEKAFNVDVLDLNRLITYYGWHIYSRKGCVSTAMPLCNWPCSCYPSHGLRQANDWMGEICEKWVSAHGVIIFTLVY